MANGYTELIRDLSEYASSLGYKCRTEAGAKHVKFYFGHGGKERFLILSHGGSYNGGTAKAHMFTRFRREMVNLPPPVSHRGEMYRMKVTNDIADAIGKAASGEIKLSPMAAEKKEYHGPVPPPKEPTVEREGMIDPSLKSPLSFPMHVSIGGKGEGGLVIRFPIRIKDEFFPDATHCDLIYVEGRHFGLAFGQHGKAKIGGVNGGKSYQCYFSRDVLPIAIAASADTENTFGKVVNNALISTTSLPKHFLAGFAPVKGADTMADGIAARKLLNDWLARAKSEGMDPEVVFDPKTCTISIRVAEVRKVTL